MTDMNKIAQGMIASLAAVLLTATAVGAAVGPARAVETAPIALVAAQVSGQAVA